MLCFAMHTSLIYILILISYILIYLALFLMIVTAFSDNQTRPVKNYFKILRINFDVNVCNKKMSINT